MGMFQEGREKSLIPQFPGCLFVFPAPHAPVPYKKGILWERGLEWGGQSQGKGWGNPEIDGNSWGGKGPSEAGASLQEFPVNPPQKFRTKRPVRAGKALLKFPGFLFARESRDLALPAGLFSS